MKSQRMITVFEDRYTEVELSQNEKVDLLTLEPLWGRQNFIIRADNRLLLKQYVGFVASKNIQLQILPKVFYLKDQMNSQNEKEQAIQLLFRLLHYSNYLKIKEIPDPQTIASFEGDLLEIFIYLFVNKFVTLFNRNVFRQYEKVEDNTMFIKGRILFQQSLLRNYGLQNLHYVQFDEFTENTILNQIVKTILEMLLHISKSSRNKTILKKALIYLEDVQTIRLTENVFNRVSFNRLNEQYKPILEMAKMFYHSRQPGFMKGNQNTFTFLIPLNRLFEYTIYKLIRNGFNQKPEWKVQHESPQKYLVPDKNKYLLKPDITLRKINTNNKLNRIELIFDAKYKNPVINNEIEVSQSDLYQMMAYAIRYNCDQIILIYPLFKGNELFNNPLAQYRIPYTADNKDINITILHIDLHKDNLQQLEEDIHSYIVCI